VFLEDDGLGYIRQPDCFARFVPPLDIGLNTTISVGSPTFLATDLVNVLRELLINIVCNNAGPVFPSDRTSNPSQETKHGQPVQFGQSMREYPKWLASRLPTFGI
jgi:hypothetical protein